jgi:hypothetical protein
MWKNAEDRAVHRCQYDGYALHPGYLRLQTLNENMQEVLLFYCNNGCTNATKYYFLFPLPVLFCLVWNRKMCLTLHVAYAW